MRKSVLAISAFLGLLLLMVAACGGSYDDDSGGPAGGDAVGVPRGGVGDGDAAGEAPSDNSDDSGTEPAGGTGSQSLLDRKIVRTATLELEVENVGTGVADVERIATAAGGFVSSSNLTIENPNGDESEQRQIATLTIRVPSSSYASVMSELRGVAEEVTSETSNASEVTEEYTDLQSRLRTLEANENRYLELLSQAETIDEILTVQDRLNTVVSEIEQVKGRMNLLDDLTDLATITVELNPPLAPAAQPTDGKGWAQEAWDTAWATSEDALKVFGTIGIGLGVLAIWLVIPGAIGLIGWRLYERRKTSGGAA
jgi:hypothetical protein